MIKEIFGKKIGMTQFFDGEGDLIGVTLLEVEPVSILEEIKYPAKTAVKIGFCQAPEKRINKLSKPQQGYFKKLGINPYKFVREVPLDGNTNAEEEKQSSDAQKPEVSETESQNKQRTEKKVGVEIFKEGEIVDVRSKSKGKGFAGGMKRHGWQGQPGSHGSTTHRRIGSAGSSAYPSRIVKGHRMPGHMGDAYRTVRNLKVLKADPERQLLFIIGSIPGSRGSWVKIVKK